MVHVGVRIRFGLGCLAALDFKDQGLGVLVSRLTVGRTEVTMCITGVTNLHTESPFRYEHNPYWCYHFFC